tara:strand:+ start:1095 stop:1721 length:627 start_codon:yes stop_codon:yes gene_type:complete
MANKENRGWLKPSEFNMLAKRAQLDLIKDRVGNPSPDGIANGYKHNQQLTDELRTVIDTSSLAVSSGNFTIPTDYLFFLNLKFNNSDVEVVTASELNKRRKSHLNAPTQDFPIAIINSNGINIYTGNGSNETTGNCILTYVKKPADPKWSFTLVSNVEVYNSSNAVNLTLPESTHKEISHRILSYLGVNIREATVVEYGTTTVLEQSQ